ncbi:MAG: hypothetical protein ACE5GG_02365 [Candidatus Omnitrophota bacterium]
MDILDLVEQGKIKRVFRARNKISFPGAICHITQHAPGGIEPLFLEEADYIYMLHLFKKTSGKFKFDIFCHCLIRNHLHLLIRLGEDNLSLAMKELFRQYAEFFNNKYQRKGHVFCGAFRQALCFDDTYFLATSLYIHLNPLKAKIVSDPRQYRWSSCSLYAQPFSKQTFVEYGAVLGLLSEDIVQARRMYNELLEKAAKVEVKEPWNHRKALEDFRGKIIHLFPKGIVKVLSSHRPRPRNLGDLEEKIAQMRSKKLRLPEKIQARKSLVLQLQERGLSLDEISKLLDISRATTYRCLSSA